MVIRKEENVLFNDALNTFYLWLYGRKKMFYLTTHFINTFYLWLYGVRHVVKEGRKCFILGRTQHFLFIVIWKEENVLFNDALNTFYLRLYGVRHVVKEGRKCFI